MNRVVHFELGAVDPQRAVEFYKSVFGWQAQQWGGEEYWLMKTGAAYCNDTEGNIFGIFQPDGAAK